MAKGVIVLDKAGAVQLRVGANTAILPITAMCSWYDYLVVGCGSAAGAQGNLAYFDKTVSTEMGDISGSTYAANTIPSEFRTKMFDGGAPNVAKRLDAVTVVYYDNTSWDSMTMTLQYRMTKVTTSLTVAGGNTSITDWTTVSGAAIALDVQSGVTYKTLNVGSDPGLAFQLRVTANGFYEVAGLIMHLDFIGERQQ